jgi:hypothetical protein
MTRTSKEIMQLPTLLHKLLFRMMQKKEGRGGLGLKDVVMAKVA